MARTARTVNEFIATDPKCPSCAHDVFEYTWVETDGYLSCAEHGQWPCCGGDTEMRGVDRYVSVVCVRCAFYMPRCRPESDLLVTEGVTP